jgi:hypothetical protein
MENLEGTLSLWKNFVDPVQYTRSVTLVYLFEFSQSGWKILKELCHFGRHVNVYACYYCWIVCCMLVFTLSIWMDIPWIAFLLSAVCLFIYLLVSIFMSTCVLVPKSMCMATGWNCVMYACHYVHGYKMTWYIWSGSQMQLVALFCFVNRVNEMLHCEGLFRSLFHLSIHDVAHGK